MVLHRHSIPKQECHIIQLRDAVSVDDSVFESGELRKILAHRLQAAVRIPTVTYDGMGRVGIDPRWDVFYLFSEFLKTSFRHVYAWYRSISPC